MGTSLGARLRACGCPGFPAYLFMDDLITITEAAEILGIKPTSLRIYLCKDANIPRSHVLVGKQRRVFLSRNWAVERQNSVHTRPISTRKGYKANNLQP